ncbi:MAG: DUF4956 domain-containing protein [Bacillota bacterium]|jgi:uncharacterized membrane protein YhiD involved in acid resistance
MTFNDIFKSDFLENVSEFSAFDTLLAMCFSVVLALFIFLIYKKTFSGVMFSSSFSLTLIGLATVTTLVILAVSSNVVLSLGMVGALSIVRFRTAIKDPVEIVFLFWAIAVGIVIGAGMIPLAVIGSVIIGIILLICAKRKVRYQPYILVLNCQNEASETAAAELINNAVEHHAVKSKTVNAAGIELTCEIRLKDNETEFINRLNDVQGIENATLVSYNGEYMS